MKVSKILFIFLFLGSSAVSDECYDHPLEDVWLEQEKIFIGKVLSAKLIEKESWVPIIEYSIEVLKPLKGELGDMIKIFENSHPHARLPVGSTSIIFSEYKNVLSWCPSSGPFELEARAPEEYEDLPIFSENPMLLYAKEVRRLIEKYPLTSQSKPTR